MAKIHEYQGKEILAGMGVSTPPGRVVESAEQAREVAVELSGPVVLKAQAWVTGRAGLGLIQFADTPDDAAEKAGELLERKVRNFTVDHVLVEKQLSIAREFYAGVIIDDTASAPLLVFSSVGGTGIEELAREHPDKVGRQHIDVVEGLRDHQARDLVRRTGVHGKLQARLARILTKLYTLAHTYEARAAEINPLVQLDDGRIVAADCRITVDDYAAFRHPELGIEIARELDRPPTELDKIAWNVEKNDYRGTFYFIQMEQDFEAGQGYVGFHGAGGGGSMMSMDALLSQGFKIANFCDTSGNPPASKAYRAARIILSQEGIDGYFGSGSGVASQEQFHSARGLVKAFREVNLSIPAVIRLGGNQEDKAVDILTEYTRDLPAPVEGYKKDDPAQACARRFRELVDGHQTPADLEPPDERPEPEQPYTFDTITGSITFDHAACAECESKICVESCIPEILKLEDDVPVLAIERDAAKKGKCIECLACELECAFQGNGGADIHLPIAGMVD